MTLQVPRYRDFGDAAGKSLPDPAWPRTILALTLPILAFGWLVHAVVGGGTAAFDRRILLMVRMPEDVSRLLGPAWLPETLRDITSLGSTAVLGSALAVAVAYLVMARRRADAALLSVSVIGGQILSALLKAGFARPRPDLILGAPEVFTASFPSAHAMLSTVTYLTLALVLPRTGTRGAIRRYVVGVAVVLTVAIGISRVALGVHWPTDVLAGWCVGAAWTVVCWTAATWLWRRCEAARLP